MEANRFFDKHSITLTLPTPLPEIVMIILTAEADMPDLKNLQGLQVSLFPACADARLQVKRDRHLCKHFRAYQSHTHTKDQNAKCFPGHHAATA